MFPLQSLINPIYFIAMTCRTIISGCLGLLLFSSMIMAQFGKVDVSIDLKLLKEADRQKLYELNSEIKRFFTQGVWDENWSDLEIPLSIQMVVEGVSEKGAVRTYMAQVMVSGGQETRLFDKAIQFYYNAGTPLYYDAVVFEPLPFLLKFYGLLILGTEADTYEPLGGTNLLEKSRNIANEGAASDYPRGWGDRIEDLDQVVSNYGLRKARFSYYYGVDLFKSGNIEAALNEFKFMINGLKESQLKDPRDPHMLYFLKVNRSEIARLFSILNHSDWLRYLIKLDPDNESIYGPALESLN